MARLRLQVTPGARRNELELAPDGAYRVCVSARAVDGKANRAVLVLLAEVLGIPRSRISILRGESSRHKVIEIEGLEDGELQLRLETRSRALGRPASPRIH